MEAGTKALFGGVGCGHRWTPGLVVMLARWPLGRPVSRDQAHVHFRVAQWSAQAAGQEGVEGGFSESFGVLLRGWRVHVRPCCPRGLPPLACQAEGLMWMNVFSLEQESDWPG